MSDSFSETDKERGTPFSNPETEDSPVPTPFPDPFQLSLPSNFVTLHDGNGIEYLVPPYLAQPTATLIYRHIDALDEAVPHTKPNRRTEPPCVFLGDEGVEYPSDPVPTQREAFQLYAEVRRMQALYGLSFKDAAHRLYLNEVATLRAYADVRNAVSALHTKVKSAIQSDIVAPIVHLESSQTADEPQPNPDDSLPYNEQENGGSLDSV